MGKQFENGWDIMRNNLKMSETLWEIIWKWVKHYRKQFENERDMIGSNLKMSEHDC